MSPVTSRLGEYPLDELDPRVAVACVCAGSYQSIQAAELLASAGFSSVVNLTSGLRRRDGHASVATRCRRS